MRRVTRLSTVLVIFILLGEGRSWSQETSRLPCYCSHADYLLTTPGAAGTALGGYMNPAVYGMLPGHEMEFYWSDDQARLSSLRNWGVFTGVRYLGFGLIHSDIDNGHGKSGVTDYRLALAAGDNSTSVGLGYGWSRGYPSPSSPDDILQIGMVQRPCRFASIGLTGAFALGGSARLG